MQRSMRRLAWVWLAGAMLAWPVLGWAQKVKVSEAPRLEVTLAIQPDGRLKVREDLAVTFADAARTFEHRVRHRQVDRISDVQAFFDGIAVGPEGGPAQARIESGQSLRVRWAFAATPRAAHTFSLSYVASGVFGLDSGRRRLVWPVVPEHDYPIRDVFVTLTAPSTVFFFPATGIAEAGWQVAREGQQFTARVSNLAPRMPGTMLAEVSADGLELPIPDWQFDEDRASEFLLAWISGAIFILVVGAGIIWILHFQYPTSKVPTRGAAALEAPMPPAMAMALAARRPPNAPDVLVGTLVDLTQRGYVHLGSDARELRLTRADLDDQELLTHERLALGVLGTDPADPAARASRVRGRAQRVYARFTRALVHDLVGAGSADEDRVRVRRGLLVAGLAVVVLGLLCAVAVGMTMQRFGPWPMALPVTTVVVGVALLVRGGTFPILTGVGESLSAQVRARVRAARLLERQGGDVDTFAAWLPIAVAGGRGAPWIKAFAPAIRSAKPLAWFPPSGEEGMEKTLERLVSDLRPRAKAH